MLNDMVINEIIDDLQGTCQSIEDVLVEYELEYDDLDSKDFEAIDDAIFNCVCCGWWYDLAEISTDVEDDTVCARCVEDGNYGI